MAKPLLYYDDVSPPVRSVLLTMAALGVNDRIALKFVDLFKVEHLKEEYIKINPLHTVPVFVDDDVVLTDSHAILPYLCDIFGKNTNFSIEDPRKRALVLNRLCFNNAVLFQRDSLLMSKIFRGEAKTPAELAGQMKSVEEALDVLEIYLSKSKFVACDEITVADFSIVATVSTLDAIYPLDGNRCPNVMKWYSELKKLSFYNEANQNGLNKLMTRLPESFKQA